MDESLNTVFVVDDSEFYLDVARSVLEADYNVFTLDSGKALFDILDRVTPSIILLDLKMPHMDGFEINKRLKSDKKTANIPVVFLTGADRKEDETKALSEGAIDYIIKPFIPDILKVRVKLHMQQRRQIELQLANSAKSIFLANMSHEMRTPLNAIIGFSEISLYMDDLSEELRTNLMNIKGASNTLLGLINDVLDISKIESGKFELELSEYSTANMIQDSVTQSIMMKGEKPIEFIFDVSKNFPKTLLGDELRVKQLITNLLSNAFKFTIKGEVTLGIDSTVDDDVFYMRIVIRDTGIGIKESLLPGIFDMYSQAHLSADHSVMGTGLGLTISHKLAEMMGGSISVESELGVGTVFTVWIAQQSVSDELISPQSVDDIRNFRYSELNYGRAKSMPQLKLPNARILVVDDVDTNLAVAAGLLKRYDIKVDFARSGPEAIDIIRKKTTIYDAVFMDYMMPDMDGIEATHWIRNIGTAYAKNIPIIALTANAMIGNEEVFLKNNFQAYITKPIKPQILHSVIKQWVCKDTEIGALPQGDSGAMPVLDVEGINFVNGVERFGGDWEAYHRVLRTFTQNTPLLIDKLENVTLTNIHAYTVAVHGIKGACFGIEANKIATLAYNLEEAAKSENMEFIEKNNKKFIDDTRNLLSQLKAALELLNSSKAKQKKDAPDPVLMKRLQEACDRHDMNDIDEIIDELDSCEYISGGELVMWLREMADEMNYGTISERLQNYSFEDCKFVSNMT
ncbi:MAG: response regulator [Defluviitaleaceae bacterium]|nr:response regulator [Defluviitaleaceae bacterium]